MAVGAREIEGWARDGFPGRTAAPKRVVVVGAGMAGLAAALELVRAGHEVTVREAQARVGGRILTLREPFADGLCAEAGAMRIPRAHRLTMAYLDRFGLETSPFTMGNPSGFHYLHGQRRRAAEIEANPALLDFPLNER